MGERICLEYTDNNTQSFDRLVQRWINTLQTTDADPHARYYHSNFPLRWVAHQCGTCRFRFDFQSSVLDVHCRTHEIDNLYVYVVDGSFFPSNIGSNPTLTIIANALRVGEHLLNRIK